MESARKGGIFWVLATEIILRPGVAAVRSFFVLAELILVPESGVISVMVKMEVGL